MGGLPYTIPWPGGVLGLGLLLVLGGGRGNGMVWLATGHALREAAVPDLTHGLARKSCMYSMLVPRNSKIVKWGAS